jgi:uncharacterized membrane protein YebE (DUF533 family)
MPMSMDAKTILEQLLKSGQELASKGKVMAEKGLGIPASGPDRDKTMSQLGKGAALGGLLALLLGTRSGRRVTGSAVKYGTLAALGAVAYKAYKNWSASSGNAVEPNPKRFLSELPADAMEARSMKLVKAMIGAAKADGHLDDQERARIEQQIASMGLDSGAASLLKQELNRPLDPREIAQGIESAEEATEVYLASYLILDVDNVDERNYLDRLADALGITRELARKIEFEAVT